MGTGSKRVALLAFVSALYAAVCCAAEDGVIAEPSVGHLEIWIGYPAAGPYLSPLFWTYAPQFLVGEGASLLGLTRGRSGQGHGLLHLVRYDPGESLWVEQLGGKLGGTTGYSADHYPTLTKLRSDKRYGDRRAFTVFIRGLTEGQYKSVRGFLRNLGDEYERYTYGHPNCADLCADAWNRVFEPQLPPGAFWFPVDLGAHVLNLPGKLHRRLSPLGKLSPILWRNRTPDQVGRRLARLGVVHRKNRAIGDLTEDEAKKALAGHPPEQTRQDVPRPPVRPQ